MDALMGRVIEIVGSMLTLELVGAVLLTLAATHLMKIFAEHWMDTMTESAAKWRAYSALASVLIGALAGTAAWVSSESSWYIVPAVALCSGPAWRLAQTLMPERMAQAFLTATDRRYRMKSEPGGKHAA